MARKRVHEIAKEQGLTSKEVLAKLKAAGIEAKAAASSVEEAEALAALGNGAAPPESTGAATATKPKAAESAPVEPAAPQPKAPPAEPAGDGSAQAPPARRPAPPKQRPTRDSLAGERAPGAGAGGRRRVVIDSQ